MQYRQAHSEQTGACPRDPATVPWAWIVRGRLTAGIPSPLIELGLDEKIRSALLKLGATLHHTGSENGSHTHIHICWSDRPCSEYSSSPLATLHGAARQQQMTRVLYQLPVGLDVNHVVAPHGIMFNAGRWWLIGRIDGELRVLQVTSILRTEMLPERFRRPSDFSLEAFWETWASITADVKAGYAAKIRVSPPSSDMPQAP